MTHEELLKEIMQLPVEQKVELLERISRSLREDLATSGEIHLGEGSLETDDQSERERRVGAVGRLRGVLKTADPPPSDEELKDMRAEYLLEKYS